MTGSKVDVEAPGGALILGKIREGSAGRRLGTEGEH